MYKKKELSAKKQVKKNNVTEWECAEPSVRVCVHACTHTTNLSLSPAQRHLKLSWLVISGTGYVVMVALLSKVLA